MSKSSNVFDNSVICKNQHARLSVFFNGFSTFLGAYVVRPVQNGAMAGIIHCAMNNAILLHRIRMA